MVTRAFITAKPEKPTDGLCNLFVYGTLKQGGRAHSLLKGATFLGEDAVQGKLVQVCLAFPGLLEGEDEINGELFQIPLSLLPSLDSYEGVDSGLYTRKTVRTLYMNLPTEVYFFNDRDWRAA